MWSTCPEWIRHASRNHALPSRFKGWALSQDAHVLMCAQTVAQAGEWSCPECAAKAAPANGEAQEASLGRRSSRRMKVTSAPAPAEDESTSPKQVLVGLSRCSVEVSGGLA